eukprot:scaffold592_cov272-Chaetoceros_neogracile.AAC.9
MLPCILILLEIQIFYSFLIAQHSGFKLFLVKIPEDIIPDTYQIPDTKPTDGEKLPTNDEEEWLVLWVVHEVRARGGTSSGKSTSVLCVNATTTVHSSA